jgi:hypothetical protein
MTQTLSWQSTAEMQTLLATLFVKGHKKPCRMPLHEGAYNSILYKITILVLVYHRSLPFIMRGRAKPSSAHGAVMQNSRTGVGGYSTRCTAAVSQSQVINLGVIFSLNTHAENQSNLRPHSIDVGDCPSRPPLPAPPSAAFLPGLP